MRVIVTRPAQQAEAWVADLRQLGVQAVALPLIGIEAAADPAAVRVAWSELDRFDLVMFVSTNAVQQFMAAAPAGARWPAGLRAAATGPGTAAALIDAGVAPASLTQPGAGAQFDSEALWSQLVPENWHGRQMLIVRGEQGRNWLAEQFTAQGARVDFVVAYQRTVPQLDDTALGLLSAARAAPAAHGWLFSSSEAVGNLGQLAAGADWRDSVAAATHPRIAQAARAAGFGDVCGVEPTLPAVAAWCRQRAAAHAHAHRLDERRDEGRDAGRDEGREGPSIQSASQ